MALDSERLEAAPFQSSMLVARIKAHYGADKAQCLWRGLTRYEGVRGIPVLRFQPGFCFLT